MQSSRRGGWIVLLVALPLVVAVGFAILVARAPSTASRLQLPIAVLFLVIGILRIASLLLGRSERKSAPALWGRLIQGVSWLALAAMLYVYELGSFSSLSSTLAGIFIVGAVAEGIANRADRAGAAMPE